jgi:glycosyltransferase involved in cell wall biosynthesis
MWAKNVCIGTRIEAIPEIIREGTTGYLITPGDVNALAEYVCQLFADRDLLCVMAEAAYQTAKSQWHWDRVAQIIVQEVGTSHFKTD